MRLEEEKAKTISDDVKRRVSVTAIWDISIENDFPYYLFPISNFSTSRNVFISKFKSDADADQ